MKLTAERIRELQGKGVDVKMRHAVREQQIPEQPKTEPGREPVKDYTAEMLQVAMANEQNIASIIALNSAMVETIKDLAKPKQPKHWSCIIGRNSRGEMATVEIKEK